MIQVDNANLFRMPAGEWHIQGGALRGRQVAWVPTATADNLIALAIWADAVHRSAGEPVALIPYLPGARQDRALAGEALSCKVYADLINSCELKQVICADPHSDVMPALIDRCTSLAIPRIWSRTVHNSDLHSYDGLIAPDAGASKRVFKAAQYLGLPMFQAYKHRDPKTGKLSSFSCDDLPPSGRFLIVDDICDGGGTFMGLSDAILNSNSEGAIELDLWVTHGVFSGDNAENLHKYFGRIYTTDSYNGAATARYNHKFMDKLRVVPLRDNMMEFVCANTPTR